MLFSNLNQNSLTLIIFTYTFELILAFQEGKRHKRSALRTLQTTATKSALRTLTNIRAYFHGQGVKKLFQAFPRLIHSTITFTEVRENFSGLLSWLESEEAMTLDKTDYLSTEYWKKEHLPKPTIQSITWQEPEIKGSDEEVVEDEIEDPYKDISSLDSGVGEEIDVDMEEFEKY